ncbi:MAG: arsenate reductase ArsC, partial [Verrucomicrobiota bacterium]
AGSKPAGYVHPKAIEVMKEEGHDISSFESEHLDKYLDAGIDTVVTVCDNAQESCPVFPGDVKTYHWSFEDPAHATGTDEEILAEFRRIRDQIKMVFGAFAAGFQQGSGQ